ncbi:MAG TPA: FUSC family protein [Gaiellaceae bacterium]|nr:FUSC family protein [Gaiellaceae bacterium]
MDVRAQLRAARRRLDRAVLGRIVQTAVASGGAWELASLIPGHGQPFFAPIAAMIALGGQPGRRGRQALEMIVGVTLGIALGDGILAVAGSGGWQLVVGVGVAFLVATAAGAQPMIRNQAAASVILVVALHRPGSNLAAQREVDALIGGGLAILLAQFLFPVDPLELVSRAERTLRCELAGALDAVADAIAARDPAAAERALARIDALDDRTLADTLVTARHVARNAPRRRSAIRRVETYAAAAHELSVATADARTLATGALRLLRNGDAAPAAALAAVREVAEAWRADDADASRRHAARASEQARAAVADGGSLGLHALAHTADALAIEARRRHEHPREERRRRRRTQRPWRGLRPAIPYPERLRARSPD